MQSVERADWPSDKTLLAAGLFVRMADAIDRRQFVEATRIRNRLSALGFKVSVRGLHPTRGREAVPA